MPGRFSLSPLLRTCTPLWPRCKSHLLHSSFTTWLVPFEGYLIDRLGPRLVIGIGGLLVGAGWIGSGYSFTTTGLYIWYAIGGIGAGAVYGGCTGDVLKWFPDHRGLCAGIVSGAYGIGTAVTVAPIEKMIKASGYQHAFIFWGFMQGIIVTLPPCLSWRRPKDGCLKRGNRWPDSIKPART